MMIRMSGATKIRFLKSVLEEGKPFTLLNFKSFSWLMKRVLKLCDSDAIIKYLQISNPTLRTLI